MKLCRVINFYFFKRNARNTHRVITDCARFRKRARESWIKRFSLRFQISTVFFITMQMELGENLHFGLLQTFFFIFKPFFKRFVLISLYFQLLSAVIFKHILLLLLAYFISFLSTIRKLNLLFLQLTGNCRLVNNLFSIFFRNCVKTINIFFVFLKYISWNMPSFFHYAGINTPEWKHNWIVIFLELDLLLIGRFLWWMGEFVYDWVFLTWKFTVVWQNMELNDAKQFLLHPYRQILTTFSLLNIFSLYKDTRMKKIVRD